MSDLFLPSIQHAILIGFFLADSGTLDSTTSSSTSNFIRLNLDSVSVLINKVHNTNSRRLAVQPEMAPPSISLERLSPVVLFILTLSLTGQAQAHVLPRETVRPTTTLPYHHLDVVSWPLTTPPPTPFTPTFNGKAIPRRASSVGSFNTICGYIGGRLDLPATCSAGSHCVLAPAQGAVGCCPNGGPCTSGIYTGCVDVNSPPQTEIDPYVYTCTGAKVCYQNVYDGGYSQFGCGTASDMATTVRTAAGTASVVLSSLPSVSLTAPIKSLTTPITIGSRTHSWTSSEIPSSSKTRSGTTPGTSSALGPSSTAASSASSSTVISGEFATTAPAAAGSARGADKVAAIIGGTLSGLALFVTLFVVAYMLWRRNRANPRHGPGEKCGYSSSGS